MSTLLFIMELIVFHKEKVCKCCPIKAKNYIVKTDAMIISDFRDSQLKKIITILYITQVIDTIRMRLEFMRGKVTHTKILIDFEHLKYSGITGLLVKMK